MPDSAGLASAGRASAGWAVTGVGAMLALTIYRLGARGVQTVQGGLTPVEWGIFLALLLAFVIGEGRGALERRWVPSVIARARELREGAPLGHRLFAPFYGMALIGGCARSRLRAWAGVTAIIGAVLLVRALPEPWRGMVDLSVAAALAWGLVALAVRSPEALD